MKLEQACGEVRVSAEKSLAEQADGRRIQGLWVETSPDMFLCFETI